MRVENQKRIRESQTSKYRAKLVTSQNDGYSEKQNRVKTESKRKIKIYDEEQYGYDNESEKIKKIKYEQKSNRRNEKK